MQLSKVLVPGLLLASLDFAFAQPAQPPKKETSDELITRVMREQTARVTTNFQQKLRTQFKLSDDDVNAIQLFMARQDAQLQIVRKALYQVTLAQNDTELSDDEYAVFWNDFQTLLAKYRTQKAQDAAKLSEQLHLDQNLRLKSLLIMRGVIGDDLIQVTPMSETFTNSDLLGYQLRRELGKDKPQRVVVPDEKPNG